MKKFTVILKNNHKIDIDAEDEADVINKINSGHYSILPVHAKEKILITQENVGSIEEVKGTGILNGELPQG